MSEHLHCSCHWEFKDGDKSRTNDTFLKTSRWVEKVRYFSYASIDAIPWRMECLTFMKFRENLQESGHNFENI